MKAKILIERVSAVSTTEAMRIIRKEYPNARLVGTRYVNTYLGKRVPDWNDREMFVAFVDDAHKVWEGEDLYNS